MTAAVDTRATRGPQAAGAPSRDVPHGARAAQGAHEPNGAHGAHRAAGRRGRLGTVGSLVLLGSIIVSLLAASSAPTPLYATFAARWGFGAVTITAVFGVYALAVLVSLLSLGRLSDHVGRRPVLLLALLAQIVAMVVFATAGGVPELVIGRIIQGLATGAALGAIGAALIEFDRERGALTNTVTPGLGTGGGALLSALVVQFLPAPTHLVFLLLIALFAVQALGVALMSETVERTAGARTRARASLLPRLAMPAELRAPMLTAAPVLFAGWSLPGLFGSLGPGLIRQLSGSGSVILGSLGLFIVAGATPVAAASLRHTRAAVVMHWGVGGLVLGTATILTAVGVDSVWLFFLGTAVAGLGFGAAFQGGLNTVVPLTAAHQRAGVLSTLFVISYLGLGVPAVVAGFLVAHVSPLPVVTREYGAFIIVLALVALAGLLRARRNAA